MPDTIRFVTDHNVERFIGLLEQAGSDSDRGLYTRLLVAEENMYAMEEHRRDALQRTITACHARIERQAQLLAELRANGNGDLSQAEALLDNLRLISETLSGCRKRKHNGS